MKWKKEFVDHLKSAISISTGLHTWQGSPFKVEPLQREWTGTRFIISELVPEFKGQKYEILKDDAGYFIFIESYQKERYDIEEIEKAFAIGTWTEIKQGPTTIHVQLPNVEHYGGNTNPFSPIRIIQHYNLSFELGNVIKYVLRNKGSKIEDLKKAIDYLNFEIGKHENK